MSPQLAPVRCSFCAKPKEDVAKILAGPGIYICNECVDLCVDILGLDALKEPDGDNPQLQPFETLSNEHLLEHLPLIAAVSDQVEENLRGWVSYLRTQRGVTWAAIGGAMGMTRQSAWGRFSGEE